MSAPMGPMNMLCVQRTLNRGRWHGFATGLGALLSDLVYGFATLVGISFASDFFTKNEMPIQLIGSVILILFGWGVFHTNPLKGWKPDMKLEETRYVKDFVSAFLFTLSNMAVILVFITLFARFTFNPMVEGGGYLMPGIVAMAAGGILWWSFLSGFVARIRRHFNRKGLVILNRTIGSILMCLGLGGIFLSVYGHGF